MPYKTLRQLDTEADAYKTAIAIRRSTVEKAEKQKCYMDLKYRCDKCLKINYKLCDKCDDGNPQKTILNYFEYNRNDNNNNNNNNNSNNNNNRKCHLCNKEIYKDSWFCKFCNKEKSKKMCTSCYKNTLCDCVAICGNNHSMCRICQLNDRKYCKYCDEKYNKKCGDHIMVKCNNPNCEKDICISKSIGGYYSNYFVNLKFDLRNIDNKKTKNNYYNFCLEEHNEKVLRTPYCSEYCRDKYNNKCMNCSEFISNGMYLSYDPYEYYDKNFCYFCSLSHDKCFKCEKSYEKKYIKKFKQRDRQSQPLNKICVSCLPKERRSCHTCGCSILKHIMFRVDGRYTMREIDAYKMIKFGEKKLYACNRNKCISKLEEYIKSNEENKCVEVKEEEVKEVKDTLTEENNIENLDDFVLL